MIKLPALSPLGADLVLGGVENLAEKLLGSLALEEVVLIRSLLVRITGRHHDPVGLKFMGQKIEKFMEFFGSFPFENGGIGRHAEPFGFRRFDGADGDLENAFPAYQPVMSPFEAIQVD